MKGLEKVVTIKASSIDIHVKDIKILVYIKKKQLCSPRFAGYLSEQWYPDIHSSLACTVDFQPT